MSIIKKFCKNFKCRSSCSLNDELVEMNNMKNTINKLDFDEIKEIYELYEIKKELTNRQKDIVRHKMRKSLEYSKMAIL